MARDMVGVVNEALQGRYVAEREVGRGAAARVYRAHDAAGRLVALKVLHPELLVSSAAERFLREVQLVGTLDHPHIARLLDSGNMGWLVYYVMPFIEGPSLREALVPGTPMPVAQATSIGLDLLGALAHAHERGLVHRDVKPDNVILSPTEGAVLLDFGIARAIATLGAERLTVSGMTVGTAAYMSPEQVLGDDGLDHRSDIYSLGCVLFECLAGKPVYAGVNDAVAMGMQVTGPVPDLASVRPDLPSTVVNAVRRALAKAKEDRWQTAGEMGEELRVES
jgi:serine/threonine-protein kinase